MLFCPICQTELIKLKSKTIKQIIKEETSNIRGVQEEKRECWLNQIEKQGYSLSYKYSLFGCRVCGYIHDGITNAAKLFPFK